MVLSFFFHSKNSVFGLNFIICFFLFPLQVCVFASVCFIKCVFLQLLILSNATSFICCQIHLDKFFFFLAQ